MRRSKHSLSHYVLSTFDMGQLVPVGNFEVLPGDSIRMWTSALLRVTPLLTPVMHPVQVRIHHWYVPFRLLWTGWEDFITGVGGGPPPQFNISTNGAIGSLGNYLGVPSSSTATTQPVTSWPLLAYNKIWNEFYRDQDLQTALSLSGNTAVQRVAWEKDYFTAARPWTQKGGAVTVPVNGIVSTSATDVVTGAQNAMRVLTTTGANLGINVTLGTAGTASGAEVGRDTVAGFASDGGWYPSNLQVAAAAASVNDFRKAFALQRYQEARAQYGSRFTEYLRYLGIRPSDARLQRPEYLGGGRATISFSEVLRTATTAAVTSPVGDMAGHGISAIRSRPFVRFFEEHGVVLSLASLRPRTMYMDALERKWLKTTKEDYWQKELELIGEQPIVNGEVYSGAAAGTFSGVFGYQNRYSEYRHIKSYVTGEFQGTSMNDWHLARGFSAGPTLNAAFIECTPTKRVFAEQTANSIWGMFSHHIQARRLVGKRTIGRII